MRKSGQFSPRLLELMGGKYAEFSIVFWIIAGMEKRGFSCWNVSRINGPNFKDSFIATFQESPKVLKQIHSTAHEKILLDAVAIAADRALEAQQQRDEETAQSAPTPGQEV